MDGFDLGSIVAHIRADTTQFTAALDEAKAKTGGFQGALKDLGDVLKVVAVGVGIASAAAVGFGAASLKAYSESEETMAQLNQVLQTTGKNAQISAAGVDEIAKSMEQYSGKTRDSIESGQIILLQFKQVTAKTLPEFTKAMLDVSQRMGVDATMAAKTLGIALDDPTTGMSRLRRSGIDFTDSQKAAIKALQATGDIAGADALLMKSLEERVGGAAGAYRNTLGGSISSAKASLKDFEITVGATIAQYLEPLAKAAANVLSSIDWSTVINNMISVLKDYWGELDNAYKSADKIYQQILNYLGPKLEALWNTIQKAAPIVRQLIDKALNPLLEVLAVAAGKSLIWAMGLVIDALNLMLTAATKTYDFLRDHKYILDALIATFGTLATVMAFNAIFDAITTGFATFTLVTIPSVTAAFDTIGTSSALVAGKMIVSFAVASYKMIADAVAMSAAWVEQSAIAAGAWLVQLPRVMAEMSLTAIKSAASAADSSLAWVLNAMRVSFVWVTQEMPKLIVSFAATAYQAGISAALSSAAWITNAAKSSFAWVITELPKIVVGFVATSYAAIVNAITSSEAWVTSASTSAVAWVVTQLPKIIAAFIATSGAAILNALASSEAWVVSAVTSSTAWVASMATSTQSFVAFRALVSTPLVMPALVIVAAIASIYEVVKAVQAVKQAISDVDAAAQSASQLAPQEQMKQLQAQAAAARAAGDTAAVTKYANAIKALGGSRAVGGPVDALTPYLVGELGPEIFMPKTGGTIIPTDKIKGVGSVTTNINGTINIASEVDATNFLKRLTHNQELAMKGLTPVH